MEILRPSIPHPLHRSLLGSIGKAVTLPLLPDLMQKIGTPWAIVISLHLLPSDPQLKT